MSGWHTALWQDVLKLPLQILAVGGAILALIFGIRGLGLPTLGALGTAEVSWLRVVVAVLIFAVGIAVAAFLWWLSARFFGLLKSGAADAASLSAMKDLPMGLPEGTVRAVLALVVAVIGLPLLLFSSTVGGDSAIAGYINGIITGVFGFYFGTRTTGVPTQAVERLAEANRTALTKTEEAGQARQDLAAAEGKVERATGAAGFDAMLERAQRHLALARTVLNVFKPALPAGLLPASLDTLVATSERTVEALRGVGATDASVEQQRGLADVVGALTGGESPLGILLGKAGPLVAGLSPALGPVGGLAVLLGVGAKLGSSQFQRWRARILAAPLAQGLIEFGTLTPQLVHAALRQAPELSSALAARPAAEVEAFLADALLRDDAAAHLLAAYGPAGSVAAGLIAPEQAAPAVATLQQALLALYGAEDVPDPTARQVGATLAAGALPGLAQGRAGLAAVSAAEVQRLLDDASGISATAPQEEGAAFDALVMLVDTARRENIDLAAAIAELRP